MIKRSFFTDWYRSNGRVFPWRAGGTTPYQFLITEILLQQTKAEDVEKIWRGFFTRFPDPITLSKAEIGDLKAQIEFLGFGNKRSRALKAVGEYLVENCKGRVPADPQTLQEIPYVGQYASQAVLCFAFGEKAEIVDSNVLRLFSRYFGITVNRDARRAPITWDIARKLLPRAKKGTKEHNYGLLDFTAQICTPLRPSCSVCPLKATCALGKKETASSLKT